METVLKHMGQDVHAATNGREVLDMVSQSSGYDLIRKEIRIADM